ncbi:MAG: TIGR02452 family protein [Verrucomicrobiota bacterium]
MSNSRSNRRVIAQKTVEICESGYYLMDGEPVSIAESLAAAKSGTKLYRPEDFNNLADTPMGGEFPKIEVVNQTTFTGARQLLDEGADRVCSLNFASAKNPGGGFLNGSQAQEESLARASGLYPCLEEALEYYEKNRISGTCLYTHHIIYSPQVPVFRDDEDELLEEPWLSSIITAPAPNAGAIRKNEPKRKSEILPVLAERTARVLEIARLNGERNLLLGAWGCGVFRNDPAQVADTFYELLQAKHLANAFDRIRFAVLDRRDVGTYNAFRSVFAH